MYNFVKAIILTFGLTFQLYAAPPSPIIVVYHQQLEELNLELSSSTQWVEVRNAQTGEILYNNAYYGEIVTISGKQPTGTTITIKCWEGDLVTTFHDQIVM